jgi:hypothetical protein
MTEHVEDGAAHLLAGTPGRVGALLKAIRIVAR